MLEVKGMEKNILAMLTVAIKWTTITMKRLRSGLAGSEIFKVTLVRK